MMIRILFAILCAGGGIYLLQSYVQPALLEIENLRGEQEIVTDTIDKAREVIRRRDELLGTYNTIAPADIQKIRKFLPAGSAVSEFLIELEVLAKEANINVLTISFDEGERTQKTETTESIGMQTLTVTVGVEGAYEDFQKFLTLLERNLRLVDVVSITVKGQQGKVNDSMQFDIELNAYYQERTIL